MIGLITRISAGPIPRQKALDRWMSKTETYKTLQLMCNTPNAFLGKKIIQGLEEPELPHDGFLVWLIRTQCSDDLRCLHDPDGIRDDRRGRA